MCARFTQTGWSHDWKAFYYAGHDHYPDFKPGYNIAPTDPAAVLRADGEGQRELVGMRWGLIPFWAKQKKVGFANINARAETVATKPAFRDAFKRHRCIVPMDGYYEWRTLPDGKQPYLVKGDEPLAAAGLWDSWNDPETGDKLETFTIITTSAAASVQSLHDRMPVFLPFARLDVWLAPDTPAEIAEKLLLPFDGLRFRPVSRRMSNSKNKAPEDVVPIAE
jgi:putative SOS response-associated peptidase YedK